MKKIVKICGMRNNENISRLGELPVDYMGMIFYPGSPRYVDKPLSAEKKHKYTGVFVNQNVDFICEIIDKYKLDAVQLHGSETPEECMFFRQKGLEVFKAFGISDIFDFKILDAYTKHVDLFVFDTKTENYGGSGVQFNWDKLSEYKGETPFLLSGGIKPGDIEIVNKLNHRYLAGVDLNSGFEDSPGLKNIEKIDVFVKQYKTPMEEIKIDRNGFYGEFGGAFIPELLYPNVKELEYSYREIIDSEEFQNEYKSLLKDYVGRPTPLYLAKRLSEKYKANIYLKREDLNHTGAHKVNNTIGQILIARKLGKTSIIAETGAGQHGVATATVCALMNLKCIVFMGEKDIERQAPNVARMKMLGAEVRPATSGSKTLKDATNEAIRYWINNPEDTYYLIGSVVGPHPYPDMVARLQAVISEEIKWQLKEKISSDKPNRIIACVGGGSNAAGAFYHYLNDREVDLIAVEASGLGIDSGKTAATTSIGSKGIIHGSKTLLMQDEYGQITEPHSISAGLDYPGVGPLHAHLFKTKRATFLSATDFEALEAARELTLLEGIIPALESAHALAALDKIEIKEGENIVVNLSGRGDKDLETYRKHFDY